MGIWSIKRLPLIPEALFSNTRREYEDQFQLTKILPDKKAVKTEVAVDLPL